MRLYSEVTVKKIVKDVLIELLKDKEYEPMIYTKMCDKIKDYPTANPWHTGTPTEEGWYLIAFNYEFEEGVRYTTDYFKDGKWAFPMVRDISKLRAWQKIEENEDGRTD